MHKGLWLILLVLLPVSGFSQPAACTDSWTGSDKVSHLALSAWMTLAGSIAFAGNQSDIRSRRPVSALVVSAAGIGKEWKDSTDPDNHFCWKDLAANGAGILLAVVVLSQ